MTEEIGSLMVADIAGVSLKLEKEGMKENRKLKTMFTSKTSYTSLL